MYSNEWESILQSLSVLKARFELYWHQREEDWERHESRSECESEEHDANCVSGNQVHQDPSAQTRSSAHSSSSSRMMLQDCRNWITSSSSSLFCHSFNNRTTGFDFEWRQLNHVSQTQESIGRQELKEEKDKNFKFVRYKFKCFHLRCSRMF